MPTANGPIGRSHRAQVPTPSIKHCINATVQAADRLDDWIRRYVVEHPLRYRPTEFGAKEAQSFSWVSPRMTPPPRKRAVAIPNRSAWLWAIGKSLKAEYDAAATPVPSRLAALVKQFETPK
jgi:hypothetical protein